MSSEVELNRFARFALSGECDNRAHSNCPYPDRCKCECHAVATEAEQDMQDNALRAAKKIEPYLDYDAVAMATNSDGKTPAEFIAAIIRHEAEQKLVDAAMEES